MAASEEEVASPEHADNPSQNALNLSVNDGNNAIHLSQSVETVTIEDEEEEEEEENEDIEPMEVDQNEGSIPWPLAEDYPETVCPFTNYLINEKKNKYIRMALEKAGLQRELGGSLPMCHIGLWTAMLSFFTLSK